MSHNNEYLSNNMILEASQAGSRERANFQQEIMRTPKIILLQQILKKGTCIF